MSEEILKLRKKNLWRNIQELEELLQDLSKNHLLMDGLTQLLQKKQLEKQIQERKQLLEEYTKEYTAILTQLGEVEEASEATPDNPNQTLSELIRILARLYPNKNNAKRVLFTAGISTDNIPFADAALQNWFNIIEEIQRQEKFRELIKVVQGEFKNRKDELEQIKQKIIAQE